MQDLSQKLAIILLAAGQGARLGNQPKALIQRNGKFLIEQFWQAAINFKPIECISVLGFYAGQIEAVAKQYSQVVSNPDPLRGQASSVRLGLEALSINFDILLVALVDQPRIDSESITLLLTEFALLGDEVDALVPCYQGQRGNPILMRSRAVAEILLIPKMVCRQWLDQHPKRVHFFETGQDAFVCDVDTREDLLKQNLTIPNG